MSKQSLSVEGMLHTPGPWKVIPSPHGPKYACVQYGADDSYTSLEMLPADAQLTAAAPALLEALLHVRTDLLRTDFKNYAARAAYMERYIKAALKTVGA